MDGILAWLNKHPEAGTLAEWVGGLGTAGALLLGCLILWLDKRSSERRQAGQVVLKVEPNLVAHKPHALFDQMELTSSKVVPVEIYNNSKFPISQVRVEASIVSRRHLRRLKSMNLLDTDFEALHESLRWGRSYRPAILGLRDGVVKARTHLISSIQLEQPGIAYRFFVCFVDHNGNEWIAYTRTGGRVLVRPNRQAREDRRFMRWLWRQSLQQRVARRFRRMLNIPPLQLPDETDNDEAAKTVDKAPDGADAPGENPP